MIWTDYQDADRTVATQRLTCEHPDCPEAMTIESSTGSRELLAAAAQDGWIEITTDDYHDYCPTHAPMYAPLDMP